MQAMTSGNGGHSNPQNQSTTQSTVNKKTYANIMSPKKEEAIIIDSMEGLSNDDYLDGLESLISIENVRFVSKISGKRVCIFLNSKSLVEQLNGQKIKVKEHTVSIRPLIEKNKRVVISNVYPMIPHELILDLLKNSGINPVSPMQHIRAGLNKQGRSHVLSFRRQIYIKEEDVPLIPETLKVVYDNTPYWVYLSTESTNCFLCKQSGHVAKQCPEYQETSEENLNLTLTKENSTVQHNKPHEVPDMASINSKGQKRPPPSIISSTNSANEQPITTTTQTGHTDDKSKIDSKNLSLDNIFKTPRRATKIPRTEAHTDKTNDLYDSLSTAQHIIEDSTHTFVLNYHQLRDFLEKAYGQTNTVEIAHEFTDDMEGLALMLDTISPALQGKLKSRCYRLKNKLRKSILGDTGSESSQLEDEE